METVRLNAILEKPGIHIYPLSRLVHAPAANWEKLIEMIEEGKEKAFAYYLPMREGVALFCSKKGADAEQISGDVVNRARQMGGKRGRTMARDNDNAFRSFVTTFYPQISKFERSLLREIQDGVQLEGVTLFGTPHLEVRDLDDKKRFVFLHAAHWKSKELTVYMQLLSFIVEQKYGGQADQLWCMDLRTGKNVKFKSQESRLQSQCRSAAKHYARFAKVLSSESPPPEHSGWAARS